MTIQQRNSEMVEILRPDFQARYEPNFAWVNACSAILALPALRAFWPMSSIDYAVANRSRDIAGGGYHLTGNNTVQVGYTGLAPWIEFDGVNRFLSRADGGVANWADITGGETYIHSWMRGITVGGWFYFDRLTNREGLITKYDVPTPASCAYTLGFRGDVANDPLGFTVFNAALNPLPVQHIFTPAISTWYFCWGRYDRTSETVSAGVNGALPADYTTAVNVGQGNIQDTQTDFNIGAINSSSYYLDGKTSLCFLCAGSLADFTIHAIYQQTRALFGV